MPKKHYIGINSLPKNLFSELKDLETECKTALYKAYGKKSICFEHGAVGESLGKRAGCCTDHAHLHIVAAEIDLFDEISKNYKGIRISSLEDLCEYYKTETPYLFYEDNSGNMYVFDAPVVVSQYFRMLVAKKLGVESKWDWKNYPGKGEMLNTLNRLKDILK